MRRAFKRWIARTFNTWRAPHANGLQKWTAENGQARLFELPDLRPGDVVLDFGGFEGNWADRMHRDHGCTVHVFEPHPRFADRLEARFATVPDVHVHRFAVGSEEGVLTLSDDGDASSAFQTGGRTVEGRIRAAREVFAEIGTADFALAKINIEGGEYDLLPALIDAGLLPRIRMIQVQFHLYVRDDLARRAALVGAIEGTHTPDWGYPFVWEQWTRRGSA